MNRRFLPVLVVFLACAGNPAAPDVPGTTDVASPDVPAPDDASVPADVPVDAAPDVVPDVSPDLPAPFDVSPDAPAPVDVAPDLPPDVAPDVPLPTEVLGLPLRPDGVLYAGAAKVDITPVVDPGPVYLAGFGANRVATAVREPIWARALVLSRDGEYLAIVATDLVGVTGYRAGLAAAALAAEGFRADRVIVHAIHSHEGPDTLGLWGPSRSVTGLDLAYQARLVDAIVQAVKDAAGAAVPVTLRTARRAIGDVSPYFTSPEFGGRGPVGRTRGLIADSRDPVLPDDTLTALGLFAGDGTAVATIAHVNTHVEIVVAPTEVNTDFAGPLRSMLEARFGGVGILWIGTEGGLLTPLGVPMPATDPAGAVVWRACDDAAIADPGDLACHGRVPGTLRLDALGDPIPTWSSDDRWERAGTYGRLLGRVAGDLLEAAPAVPLRPLDIRTATPLLPLQNRLFEIAAMKVDPALLEPLIELARTRYPDDAEVQQFLEELKRAFEAEVLDFHESDTVVEGCPEAESGEVRACLPATVWSVQLGDLRMGTVPGEAFPELMNGVPDSPEFTDAHARGPGSTYFPYADPACADTSWEDCRWAVRIGECDCRLMHPAPYRIDPTGGPSLREAGYDLLLGLAGNMVGYMPPEDDGYGIPNRPVEEMFSAFLVEQLVAYMEDTREHYEESVSLGPRTATRVLEALRSLAPPP